METIIKTLGQTPHQRTAKRILADSGIVLYTRTQMHQGDSKARPMVWWGLGGWTQATGSTQGLGWHLVTWPFTSSVYSWLPTKAPVCPTGKRRLGDLSSRSALTCSKAEP